MRVTNYSLQKRSDRYIRTAVTYWYPNGLQHNNVVAEFAIP